ncbi:MAG TPA: C25 family cysteine peptidase, partial [Blastocatellia bacterium]|nr:C25 family cysteine peptidase [Blastocatellia bacterium]
GDGTYDPKDYVGGGSLDVVPIKLVGAETMETASDDWYADFDLDGVADIALGRLPVRSPQEVSKIAAKIIAFERGPRFDSAVLVSDVDRIYDFDGATQNVGSQIPGSVRVDQVSRNRMGDAAARAKILESISAGSTLINYIGHGTLRAWNGGLLTADDAARLLNADRPALFVLMTCLNGLFQNLDTDSLAESLVKSDAGAAAVWASSGLTKSNEQVLMNQELVRQLFAEDVTTIGEAIKRAKMHVSDPDIRRTWIFFGDPAMGIR